MTTIAYKDGIIAYDSREKCGITIMSDNAEKRINRGNSVFVMAGKTHESVDLVDSWPEVPYDENDAHGFMADATGVYMIGVDGNRTFAYKQEVPWAVGSGADHAITAMDMGCTAKEAVKMAAKRDSCTGGRIRTYRVKP